MKKILLGLYLTASFLIGCPANKAKDEKISHFQHDPLTIFNHDYLSKSQMLSSFTQETTAKYSIFQKNIKKSLQEEIKVISDLNNNLNVSLRTSNQNYIELRKVNNKKYIKDRNSHFRQHSYSSNIDFDDQAMDIANIDQQILYFLAPFMNFTTFTTSKLYNRNIIKYRIFSYIEKGIANNDTTVNTASKNILYGFSPKLINGYVWVDKKTAIPIKTQLKAQLINDDGKNGKINLNISYLSTIKNIANSNIITVPQKVISGHSRPRWLVQPKKELLDRK